MRGEVHVVGRSWWRRALAVVMAFLVAVVALMAAPAAALGVGRDEASGEFSSAEVSVLYDGQSFGELDDGPSNGVVATNDVVGYSWKLTATDLSGGLLEQTLPEGWSWDPESLIPANSSTDVFRVTGTISADGRTLSVVVETLVPGNPAQFELGALRAIPSSDVPNGSVYAAELTARGASGQTTATARPVMVASEPRAELWKSYLATASTTRAHDFGDGVGPVDARYIDYRLSIREPEGAFAIGAAAATFGQPLVLRDTYTVEGLNPGAEFQAEVTAMSVPGARAEVTQSGSAIALSLDGFGAASSAWVDVRMWVRYSDLPSSGASLTVTNTVEPSGEWHTSDGTPINVDRTNTSVARAISRPAEATSSSAAKGIYLFTDQAADGSVAGDPIQLTSQFTSLTSATAPTREVAPGSLVASRLLVRAGTVGNLSSGLTNLVAYDFWNPGEQQIVDGAAIFVGQNFATSPMASNRYTVQYTTGGDAADPESNPWFDSIESAGGVSAVAGIRIAYIDGVWKKDADPQHAWFTVGIPFRLVGDVGTQVADTAVYRYDEKRGGLSSTASISVGSFRLSTEITSSARAIMSGGTIEYGVTPVATAPPGAEYISTMQGLGVDVTLPSGLRSVRVDDAPEGWRLIVDGDAASGMTLRYVFDGEWDTSRALPTFGYQVVTDILAPTSKALVTTAIVYATGNTQASATRSATNTVSVQQVAAVSEQKIVVGDSSLQPGDIAQWEARWYNTMSSSVGRSHFVDVLPFDGDGRGTTSSGSLVVTAAEIVGAVGATRLQYTTAPAAEVVAAGAAADGVDWVDVGGTDPAGIVGISALRVVVDDFVATGSGYLALRVSARIDGAKDGDRFVNTVDAWLGVGGHLGESNSAAVDVVAGTIDGTVWLDAPDSRVLTDRSPLSGATVALLDEQGGSVAAATTDADGHYSFDGLRGGGYRVTVDTGTLGAAQNEHIVNVFDHDGNVDSDSGPLTLEAGQAVHEVDFGYRFDTVAIALTKAGRVGDDPRPGDAVDWSFTITNIGASDLTDVDLFDHLDGVRDLTVEWGDGAPGSLPAGASVSATATSPLTAADLAAGRVTNTATATGAGPAGIAVTADAEATVTWDLTGPGAQPGGDSTASGGGSAPGGLAVTGANGGFADRVALGALGAVMIGALALLASARRRQMR